VDSGGRQKFRKAKEPPAVESVLRFARAATISEKLIFVVPCCRARDRWNFLFYALPATVSTGKP